MSGFRKLFKGSLAFFKSFTKNNEKTENPAKTTSTKVAPKFTNKNIPINEHPVCLKCHRTLVYNGRGAQKSQAGLQVEYLLFFCSKCGTTALTLTHVKIDRNDPKVKPTLGTMVFWGHPVERREVNGRLRKLEENLKRYDALKEEQLSLLDEFAN